MFWGASKTCHFSITKFLQLPVSSLFPCVLQEFCMPAPRTSVFFQSQIPNLCFHTVPLQSTAKPIAKFKKNAPAHTRFHVFSSLNRIHLLEILICKPPDCTYAGRCVIFWIWLGFGHDLAMGKPCVGSRMKTKKSASLEFGFGKIQKFEGPPKNTSLAGHIL